MVYIVSDERIAVENFEQGKIYKVIFVDESILYGVCIGIGSDFVMLSGDISGYIYPLTMQTASQVSSIDLYTPVEPEPPISDLLQYQTGVAPFEFTTTDTSLFSWYIEGECGDRTKNEFDKDNTVVYNAYFDNSGRWRSSDDSRSILIAVQGNTSYVLSVQDNLTVFRIYQTSNSEPQIGDTFSVITRSENIKSYTFTTSENTLYIAFQGSASSINEWLASLMLNEGSTALPYEPYGYKIPVICNEHTTTIYLDAPLSDGEILYSTDIDTAIVTDIGDNELSVETRQQPTSMQIVYKIADR